MKGKRYTTEDKIRTLREADGGKAIVDICREKNLSEVTFPRWKRQFGHMELNEARRRFKRRGPGLRPATFRLMVKTVGN